MAVSSPPIDTTVPAQSWVTLTSGGIQVSSALTVPNITYLSPSGGQNGLVGGGDGQVIYLVGTAAKLDGGQQWLMWDAASVAVANGATVFNPWVVAGTPGRWKTATIAALPGLQQNGVVYFDGTTLKTNTGLTYNITQLALSGRLLVSRNAVATPPDVDVNSPMRVIGADNNLCQVWLYAAGVGAGFGLSTGIQGMLARGSMAAPSALLDADIIVVLAGGGYGTTAWKSNAGGFVLSALGNWSDTQQGTRATIGTTTQGTAIPGATRVDIRQGVSITTNAGALPTGGDPGPGSINLAGTLQFNGVDIKGNVPATATNNAAVAGTVGEIVRATATGVALVNNTAKDVITQVLQPGDWDVWGVITFTAAGTTTITALAGGSNTAANTLLGDESAFTFNLPFTTGQANTIPVNSKQYSLAAPTTVRIVGLATFGTSTMTAGGVLVARRRR